MSMAAAGMLLFPALVPVTVGAATELQTNICGAADNPTSITASGGDCSGGSSEESINGIVKFVINTFSVIVGIIAVVMIIVGGVKYITSGGASDKVTSAKNTILFAIIGLVIVAIAQILVKYVLAKAVNAGQ
jgi:hypothetical protein